MSKLNRCFCALRGPFAVAALLALAACGSPEEQAKSHYENAVRLVAEHNDAKAAVELKNAVQKKPDYVAAWRALAELDERSRNWGPLAADLREIAKLAPRDIDTRLRLGKLMLLGNAVDQSLKLADEALAIDEAHAGAHALKAAVLLKLNDPTGAAREAKAALEADPGNIEALVALAAERMMAGDAAGALQILDRGPLADTDNIGVQVFKIQLLDKLGDAPRTEALLKKLIELYPKELLFQRALARFYISHKRQDEAETTLRAMAGANPADIQAGLDVVRYLAAVKGAAAARQELLARIDAGGDVFAYQMALAGMHFADGDYADSVRMLESLAANAKKPEHALAARVRLAEYHLAKKKLEAADAVIAGILAKDNRNTEGLRLRASLRIERGELESAVTDLRQALNDQPRAAVLMLLLAQAYERSGSIELADKQYADAVKASGYDASVGLTYVAFLRRRGSIAHAEDTLAELASRWPADLRVLSALADVRLARRNWAGAQEIAETIRRLGEDRGLADQILGAALSGRSKYEESISALQSAYAAAPAVQPMVALVSAYVRAKKPDQAVAFLEAVLEKNPDNAQALVLMGDVRLAMSQPDAARKSFESALEKQPKSPAAYRALADFYIRQKSNDEALKVLQRGLAAQPDNFGLRLTLAGLYEIQGNVEAAITEYEALLKDQSGSLVVANNLASLLSDYRTDKASLDRAYALAVNLRKVQVPQFKDTLGWVNYQRGDYKAALALLEEAAASLDQPLVRYHLGMCYLALGDSAKASEQLKKALALAASNPELEAKIQSGLKKLGT
jgi:tetratricopeptide (TPR) repeat protein